MADECMRDSFELTWNWGAASTEYWRSLSRPRVAPLRRIPGRRIGRRPRNAGGNSEGNPILKHWAKRLPLAMKFLPRGQWYSWTQVFRWTNSRDLFAWFAGIPSGQPGASPLPSSPRHDGCFQYEYEL